MNANPQWNNPVRKKELRLSLRAVWRLLPVLVYVTVIGVLAVVYLSLTESEDVGQALALSASDRSRELFLFLSGAQLLVIALLAPGLTVAGAGAGTGHGTWNAVQSRLRSSLRAMMRLVLSTAPIYGILYHVGGIGLIQLLTVFLYYLFVLFVMGCFGVYYSTVLKRTSASVAAAYGMALVMFVGTGLAAVYLGAELEPNGGWGTGLALGLNPMAVLISLLNPDFSGEAFGPQSLMQLWHVFLPVYSLLCAALLGLTARNLRG